MDNYHAYGGRGITFDPKWRSFEAFVADMGERPSRGFTIERINNEGNYTKENCRWATRKEQSNNGRHNRKLSAFGKTLTISQWQEEANINQGTIRTRLVRGLTVEQALTLPLNFRRKK
jgi:hypothetical protein